MATVNEIWAAYEAACGVWSGCNWPTEFGSLGMDLNGISSRQAAGVVARWREIAAGDSGEGVTAAEGNALADMALHLRLRGAVACLGEGQWPRFGGAVDTTRRACAEAIAREWQVAAYLLAEIESEARWAEREAWDAVRSAEGGDWAGAVRHARQATAIESGYHALRLWCRLKSLIETAAAQTGPSGGRDELSFDPDEV